MTRKQGASLWTFMSVGVSFFHKDPLVEGEGAAEISPGPLAIQGPFGHQSGIARGTPPVDPEFPANPSRIYLLCTLLIAFVTLSAVPGRSQAASPRLNRSCPPPIAFQPLYNPQRGHRVRS